MPGLDDQVLEIIHEYKIGKNLDGISLEKLLDLFVSNTAGPIFSIIKPNEINDLGAQHLLLKILASKLVILDLDVVVYEILLSICLAVVEVNLHRLLYHIDILLVLILKTGNDCAMVWLTEDVDFVGLMVDLSSQFASDRAAQRLQHRGLIARRALLPSLDGHGPLSAHFKVASIVGLRSYS